MDYELERLHSRSFEQLVQALAIAVIGPHVTVFGDGPDGGREATFDGRTEYTPTAEPWNGYGIIQAKFRQIPHQQAKYNAEWALTQAKTEFASFAPKSTASRGQTPRICPDYYVFATNVALSAAHRTGGKDKLSDFFYGMTRTHGLVDYAIWDRNQICRYLEVHADIRTSYAAFILPGDVLSQLLASHYKSKPAFPNMIRRFLETELLDDQFARLSQGGYTDAKTISLSSVFIDLPLQERDALKLGLHGNPSHCTQQDVEETPRLDEVASDTCVPTFISSLFMESRTVLRPSRQLHTQSVNDVLGTSLRGRLVLIGGPGQGKTTAGQFACQLLRASLLRSLGGTFSPEVEGALQSIELMSDTQLEVGCRRYPVRIELKHLANCMAAKGTDRADGILDYLAKRISRRTHFTIDIDDLRQWLNIYPWLLVLDGLDEVPISSNREQVLDAIRDFISVELHELDSDMLVLATTRPQGYSEDFDPTQYTHLHLDDLNADQACAYGEKLSSARHPGQTLKIEELSSALRRAINNPATARLMKSPLQVTIMLALIEGGGEPPDQRWKLFHDYYHVIYKREKERDTAYSELLRKYEPDLHWIHRRAGWELQKRNATAGQTSTIFDHIEFDRLVDNRLKAQGHQDPPQRLKLVEGIRQAATDRLVLLVGNTESQIGFEIRSLQEFMAAEHCFDGGEACVRQSLHSFAVHPYWNNVFLFATGRIFFERQELIEAVLFLCNSLNDADDDTPLRKVKTGSRLALEMLRDGTARNQPRTTRLLARCAAGEFDNHDADIDTLLPLCIDEVEEVWRDELQLRVCASEQPTWHKSALFCIKLAEAGSEWAEKLIHTSFPWRTPRAESFIASSLNTNQTLPEFFWSVVRDDASVYSPSAFVNRHQKIALPTCLTSTPLSHIARLNTLNYKIKIPLEEETGIHVFLPNSGICSSWPTIELSDQELVGRHPEWRFLESISRFCQQPSLSKLEIILSEMRSHKFDFPNRTLLRITPWQIRLPLQKIQCGTSWEEMIDAIRSGSIGDESDWEAWASLSSSPISLGRLFSSRRTLVSSDEMGLLFEIGGWAIETKPIGKTRFLCTALGEYLASMQDAAFPSPYLIELCCAQIRLYARYGALPNEALHLIEVIRQFSETCLQHNISITSDLVEAAYCLGSDINTKFRLLGDIGKCEIGLLPGGSDLTVVRERNIDHIDIETMIENEPNCHDILYSLSFLPPIDSLSAVPPVILGQMKNLGGRYEEAASRLSLASFHQIHKDPAQAAVSAIEIDDNNPGFLSRILTFIDNKKISGSDTEYFVSCLIDRWPNRHDSDFLSGSLSLLRNIIVRRPIINELPDPDVFIQPPK